MNTVLTQKGQARQGLRSDDYTEKVVVISQLRNKESPESDRGGSLIGGGTGMKSPSLQALSTKKTAVNPHVGFKTKTMPQSPSR